MASYLNRFIGYVATCRKNNTDDWMHGLIERINRLNKVIGEKDRVKWDKRQGVIVVLKAKTPMAGQRKCEGACRGYDIPCVEPAERVRVLKGTQSWGEFWYCPYAISDDLDNGFTVEFLGAEKSKRAKQ